MCPQTGVSLFLKMMRLGLLSSQGWPKQQMWLLLITHDPLIFYQPHPCLAMTFLPKPKKKNWSGAYIGLALLINEAAHAVVHQGAQQSQLMLALDGDRVVLCQPGPN